MRERVVAPSHDDLPMAQLWIRAGGHCEDLGARLASPWRADGREGRLTLR